MKKKHLLWISVLYFLFCTNMSFANDISQIKSVAGRVAPWLSDKIVAIGIPAGKGKDVYELSTKNGKLLIKANNMPAAGMALNHYLKHVCKRHFSLVGTNLVPIDTLPLMEKPIRKESPFKYRHVLNFCTQNYSASFWEWKDWERMIDFMVLNGVNLTIATVGLEKVWYETLSQFNFSHDEIMEFLPGPAFNAWHIMANHEGWGGPITMEIIEQRAALEKKIVDRLKEYDIDPVFLSFYGMVPTKLKDKYPDADIKDQGRWAGGFRRPSILIPGQKLYDEMADVYYRVVKKLYGEFSYFAGEPFHEGGDKKGIDVGLLAKNVLNKMRQHNPGAVWVLQSWSGNPSAEFLSRMSRNGDVLIWDFRGETAAEWEERKGYEGYPYLWGVINNFGGKPGLYGRLERFNTELFRAKYGQYGKNMQGLSMAPESILDNPVNYDFLYELAWNNAPVDVDEWIEEYCEYRYGETETAMKAVWEILLNTAYSNNIDSVMIEPESKVLPSIVGNGSSVICAPPALDLRHTSSWDTSILFYDYKKMRAICPYLLEAIDRLNKVDAFQYDLVDFIRQLISNEFRANYYLVNEAIKQNDLQGLEKYSTKMLELLDDMDDILSTRSEFMLGRWLNSAKRMAGTDYERKLYEKNARALITYWGPDVPDTDLRDYAHKEWAGLIKDVYKPRWCAFFDYHKKRIQDIPCKPMDYIAYEIDWGEKTNLYPETPQLDIVATSKRILHKLMKL